MPDMLEKVLSTVQRHLKKRILKRELLSDEIPEYPILALREILVNAVAHRDYGPGALGSHVEVKIFTDSLVVQSPGGLFGPATEDTLDEVGVHATRNVFLVRLLEGLGMVENRGTGIRTVLAQLAKAQLPPPDFEDRRTFFRVTFSNESLLDEETVRWLSGMAGFPLNDRQRLALAYLKKHAGVNNVVYRRLARCDSREATSDLGELTRLGLIVRKGDRRWTTYELAKRDAGAQKTTSARTQQALEVFRKLRRATTKQVAAALGVSRSYAVLLVRDLVQKKLVRPLEKRNSRKQSYQVI